jgi:tetratricopeptide (TPR) repeat protein
MDYDRIDAETNDAGLEYRDCPAGHRKGTITMMVGFACNNLEDMKIKFANMDKKTEKCHDCGKDIPASPPAIRYMASYLPMAKMDLCVCIQQDGQTSLALASPGGELRDISPEDPAVNELGPATSCRGAAVASRFGNPDRSVEEMSDVLTRWPEYPPAMVVMGRILKRRGDLAGAKEWLEAALARAPDLPEANFALADVLDEVGEEGRALELYDRAARLRPRDPQVFVQRGVLKARLGMREAAIPDYQHALSLEPHNDLALINLAVNFHHLGRHEEIPDVISLLSPSNLRDDAVLMQKAVGITMECGERMFRASRMHEAARCFEIAAGFEPDNASIQFNWGVSLANTGALADSAIRLRQALRLNPGHQNAKRMLPQVEKALSKGGGGVLGMRQRHSIIYIDSTGRDVTMLNYIVKIETTDRFIETEVDRLSPSRDKDLVKMLVAKGHNKRVSIGMEGRFIEYRLQDTEPDPAFIALASAKQWITKDGKTLESAVVPIYFFIGEEKKGRMLTNPSGGPPFRLDRIAGTDRDSSGERFYPPEFADYDEDSK